MSSPFYTLKCYDCGQEHSESESVTNCVACGGPLETYYDYERIDERLNIHAMKTAPISAMKYVGFYPINDFRHLFSLQEGGTPLIHAKKLGESIGLNKLYIKNEGANPTGVFKDRGTLVEVTKARELGANAICLASTGNMAASVAAYASVVGLPCFVLVPEGTPIGKLSQTLVSGAKVIQVRGTYSDCAVLAEKMAKRFNYYLAGDYTFRTEGQKSQGYEIIEQLFWRSPDYLVCPVGCGTNLHAIYKGMQEFKTLGLINRLPKIIAVQAPGCNPIVTAFTAGSRNFEPVAKPDTIASAVAAGNPLDGRKVLNDIYDSHGIAVQVEDNFLLKAQLEQMRVGGVFSEPSGVLSYAAVKQLAADHFFDGDETIVCIATGNGLKDPRTPMKTIPEPASVEPDFDEIAHFIENKLYAIREGGQRSRERVLFDGVDITSSTVQEEVAREFDVDISSQIADEVASNVTDFRSKGRQVTKGDLRLILEEVLDKVSLRDPVLVVVDFDIRTTYKGQATATITANLFGENKELSHNGVGPVDAAISALQEGLRQQQAEVKLTDYEVSIDDSGVDATVEVKMTLVDQRGYKVVSRATSPDIIVASIKAFEKGYNLLHAKKNGGV